MMKQPRFPCSVKLADDTRKTLIEGLNVALATSMDLFTQVKQAHWNLKGPQFFARHQLFDDLASHLNEHADDYAERAATLGGYATGTLRMAAERTVLKPYDERAVSGVDHLRALRERFAAYTTLLRNGIEVSQTAGDPATEDLYIEKLRSAEFDLWFLESHLIDG